MKKLIGFLCLVLLIIVAIDGLTGVFARKYLEHHTLPGDYESIDHLMKNCKEKVIIIGSSVALNDINPNIIADSLEVSCFNGGANAQLFPFFETMLDGILHHDSLPSTILLALRPDELGGTGLGTRFNILTPYYKRGYEMLDRQLESASPMERYFLTSNLYRYNTIWWRILLYHFISPGIRGKNGFTGKPVPNIYPSLMEMDTTAITEERKHSFDHFIKQCKAHSIHVMVFFPPILYKKSHIEPTIRYVSEYCHRNAIPCFDDSQDASFLADATLFYDNTHLNIHGSDRYSQSIIAHVRDILKNPVNQVHSTHTNEQDHP